jgi:hypothetical protein
MPAGAEETVAVLVGDVSRELELIRIDANISVVAVILSNPKVIAVEVVFVRRDGPRGRNQCRLREIHDDTEAAPTSRQAACRHAVRELRASLAQLM